MPSTQELTRRIKSIKSTRKVTRAMQMISAAKMRKSQAATVASRTYSELALSLVRSLGGTVSASENPTALNPSYSRRGINAEGGSYVTDVSSGSPPRVGGVREGTNYAALMQPNTSATKALVVVISTNKGLVGGFNSNLFVQIKKLEEQHGRDNLEYVIMGRKAMDMAVRMRRRVLADFAKSESTPSIDQIAPVARLISDSFISGEYNSVYIVYNHFISTLSQQARTVQLLPLSLENDTPPSLPYVRGGKNADSGSSIADVSSGSPPKVGGARGGMNQAGYLIEPSPEKVLSHLLPKVLESQLYQTLLESDASEHSARMIMMKNATESAGDLIADLTLTFNQLRQNKITTELSEITAGKIALEGQ